MFKSFNMVIIKTKFTYVIKIIIKLISSMRFEGVLNIDLNEITMNLVPFPR
jgi:hypothetical protein